MNGHKQKRPKQDNGRSALAMCKLQFLTGFNRQFKIRQDDQVFAPGIEDIFNNHQFYDKNGVTSSRLRRKVNIMSLMSLNNCLNKMISLKFIKHTQTHTQVVERFQTSCNTLSVYTNMTQNKMKYKIC